MSPTALASVDVCFLAGTLGQGGAERQLYYMLRALRGAGASPRVLSLTRGEFWEAPIRALGVPVTWVGENPSRLARLRRITAEMRRRPPTVVQGQHFFTNLYATAAARASGAREVGAIRSDCASEVAASGPVLGPLGLRLPRSIAVNSAAAIRDAIVRGASPARLHLLRNVVDTERFAPSPRAGRDGVTLLGIGRLASQKRFDRLLEVLARVRRSSAVPVRAVIAGAGPRLAELEARAARLGLLPDAVTFAGKLADVAPLYADADVYVLTSDREGTPNVVLEAMACGLPVVTTAAGDVAEVVADGDTGLVVPLPADATDPAEEERLVARLADAVRELVEDPDARRDLGARARAHVERHHAASRLDGYLADLYAAVLS